MAVYVFDFDAWAARYPALAANVSPALASEYFLEATLYLSNTDSSIVQDVTKRGMMLNALVAHIAALEGATGSGTTGLVGRVQSATEGSVTISMADYPIEQQAAWFAQTQYGASFWRMTTPYRRARYVPGPADRNRVIDAVWRDRGIWSR